MYDAEVAALRCRYKELCRDYRVAYQHKGKTPEDVELLQALLAVMCIQIDLVRDTMEKLGIDPCRFDPAQVVHRRSDPCQDPKENHSMDGRWGAT